MSGGVAIRGLTHRFGSLRVLDGIDLDVAQGSFFGLLGPSGSGKTTLLRAVAGFVFPEAGRIEIGGVPVERVPVERREIGMVFQNYALFPNMSVAENVGFGLRVRRVPRAERAARVAEALALVQLGPLGDRRAHQLSGGQRQRVALARAIVTRPRVLLLDEPLSALDKALRVEMQVELKRIQREVGITTVFVTHDQEEALTLSDRIGILRDGRLVQEGPPRAVYDAPATVFAARFLGEANILEGVAEGTALRLAGGDAIALPASATGPLAVAVRPEAMELAPTARPGWNALPVTVEQTIFSGPTATHLCRWAGTPLRVLTKGGGDVAGAAWVTWPIAATVLLAPEVGA